MNPDALTLLNQLFAGELPRWASPWEEFKNQIIRNRDRERRPFWIGEEHPLYAWYLRSFVQLLQPERILEIGVQCGGSAYGLIDVLPERGVYVGIDNEADVNAKAGMSDFYHLYGRPNTFFVTGEAAGAFPLFAGRWDLVHFDHYKDCYLPDLARLQALGQVDAQTLCVFHDTDNLARHLLGALQARFAHHWTLPVNEGATACLGLV